MERSAATDGSRLDALLARAAAVVGGWSPRKFLAVLIAVQALLHVPVFPLQPMGQHTWRQMMWAAPARNWAEDGGSFWNPQHDVRVAPDDPGYLYHEFPLLFWLIGQSYRVTGVHDLNGRLLLFVAGAGLLVGAYALMKALGYAESRARWFTAFVAASPWFFYYSVTLESSLPALAWFVGGLALLVPALRVGSVGWRFWLALLLIGIGTLSKQTFLFFGLPVAWLFWHHGWPRRRWRLFAAGGAAGALLLAAHALIYWHTLALYAAAPWERQAYWELKPVPPPQSWADAWHALVPPLVTWIPELFVNTAALPFCLAGLAWACARPEADRERRGFWLAWTLSLLLFCAVFLTRLREHEYYLTPIVMLAALLSSGGAERWLAGRRLRWLAALLLVVVPLVMVGRVYHRWTTSRQVPAELLDRAAEIQNLIPRDARVVVVGDSSPLVYLYFLHRKGVSMQYTASMGVDGGEAAEWRRLLGQGFRWAVTSRPLGASGFPSGLATPVGSVGRFTVVRLDGSTPR